MQPYQHADGPREQRVSKKRRSKKRKQQRSRSGYPTPAERERILKRRHELLRELIAVLAFGGSEVDREMIHLMRRYGAREVQIVGDAFQKTARERDLIGEEAYLYRVYRHAFARFGGTRPYLSKAEYERLSFEYTMLYGERTIGATGPESPRERELYDLLLLQPDYWADITPPAVPSRPPDLNAPSPGQYGDPVRELFNWGWKLDLDRIASSASDTDKWQPTIPDLLRMVLDPGLLEGWPGELSSWAPYHGLHLLGLLGADACASQLLALLDVGNDWLSDRLPTIWTQMGPGAEPPLWEYLNDRTKDGEQRAIALKGLISIAQTRPERRSDVVNRLVRILNRSPADEAPINGHIVRLLDEIQAVEAAESIARAFSQDRVDIGLIGPDQVDILPAELRDRIQAAQKAKEAQRLVIDYQLDFGIGDSVRVKPGVKDPDLGIDIGGWQGRATDIRLDDDDTLLVDIRWDSVTLQNMPHAAIQQCEEMGLDWSVMVLAVSDVELAAARDNEADVEHIAAELADQHAWDHLDEQGKRIAAVLAAEEGWEGYLEEHLTFPFEAEVDEFQSRGPIQAGDQVRVTGVSMEDEMYGIIADVKLGRRKYAFPLADLEVLDLQSPNYQIIRDYRVWFANR